MAYSKTSDDFISNYEDFSNTFTEFFELGLQDDNILSNDEYRASKRKTSDDILKLLQEQTITKYLNIIDNLFKSWVYGMSSQMTTTIGEVAHSDYILTDGYFDNLKAILEKDILLYVLDQMTEDGIITTNSTTDELKKILTEKAKVVLPQVTILLNTLHSSFENMEYNITLMNFKALETVEKAREITVLKNALQEIKRETSKFKVDIEKDSERIKEVSGEVKKQSQKAAESSITILGIFVGVVMVFFGGFSILENAITGMTTASPFRLYFTMLAFGAIMYDIVILLFFLISRIIEKSITCECIVHQNKNYANENRDYEKDKSTGSSRVKDKPVKCMHCPYAPPKTKYLCRLRHTMPYAYWGNVGICSVLVLIVGLKYISNACMGVKPVSFLIFHVFMATISISVAVLLWVYAFQLSKPRKKKKTTQKKQNT